MILVLVLVRHRLRVPRKSGVSSNQCFVTFLYHVLGRLNSNNFVFKQKASKPIEHFLVTGCVS